MEYSILTVEAVKVRIIVIGIPEDESVHLQVVPARLVLPPLF